jgi:hypothetical protein
MAIVTRKKKNPRVMLLKLKKRANTAARAAQDIRVRKRAIPYDMDAITSSFAKLRDRFSDATSSSPENTKVKLLVQRVEYCASRLALLLYSIDHYSDELCSAAKDLKRYHPKSTR